MIRTKSISEPVFGTECRMVLFDDLDEFSAYMLNKYGYRTDYDGRHEFYGSYFHIGYEKGIMRIVALNLKKHTTSSLGHETIHLVIDLLEDIGIKIGFETEEVFAYLWGYYYRQFFKFFMKYFDGPRGK